MGINWFRDSLRMIDTPPQISDLAAEVPNGTDGLYFVSAFSGLLAPHWRDDARGTLVGLTLRHTKAHVARAVLEGIAFQAKEVAWKVETALFGAAELATSALSPRPSWLSAALAPPEEPHSWLAPFSWC